jgi:hypothetical protein
VSTKYNALHDLSVDMSASTSANHTRRIIEEDLESALIMEDDMDW